MEHTAAPANGVHDHHKGSVLVLGSGLVCPPLVHYLSSYGYRLTLASRTVAKAQAIISALPPTSAAHVKAVAYDIETDDASLTGLSPLIASHDLTVSLLPYIYHVRAAQEALRHRKHFFTTSYISPQMQDMHEQVKQAGLVFMNEAGLDPGQRTAAAHTHARKRTPHHTPHIHLLRCTPFPHYSHPIHPLAHRRVPATCLLRRSGPHERSALHRPGAW